MTLASPNKGSPMRAGAALAVALLLAACAGSPPATFDLTAADPPPERALRAPLRIAEPIASVDLDSDRILVRTGPQQVATLADARWSERLPLLVQSRLNETFENSGFTGVARRATAAANYELDLDIRAFELDVPNSRVRVDLAAKIVATNGKAVATQIFTAEEPIASTSPPAVSAALNSALASVMAQIVTFVSTRI
jgi:cholesterol transport system auxiliary component